MDATLGQALIDAVDFLVGEDIAYALVGGLAASLRGQPRVTADVDLVLAVDVPGALLLLDQLNATQFVPLFDGVREIVERAFILPLRHRTTRIKLDLAIGLSGFERQIVERAEVIEISGRAIRVATVEDLLIMKVLAGRPQDEQDVAGMVIAQGRVLDWDYCEQTASDLGQAIEQDLVKRVRDLRASV